MSGEHFPLWNWTITHLALNTWLTLGFPCLHRSLRSAMHPRPRSSVTTRGMTSSPVSYLRTPTRPRQWWTSSRRWDGTTCPRSPQRGTTARAVSRPLCRSPGKQVHGITKTCSDTLIQTVLNGGAESSWTQSTILECLDISLQWWVSVELWTTVAALVNASLKYLYLKTSVILTVR